MPESRRFPPLWTIEEANDACFIVRDATRQALGYFYFEEEPGRRSAAKLLTRDEARRMAALWKMTSISIESPAMSAEALYAVLAMPSARNRNQQTNRVVQCTLTVSSCWLMALAMATSRLSVSMIGVPSAACSAKSFSPSFFGGKHSRGAMPSGSGIKLY